MKQPTDRMLIDALCIVLADLYSDTNREEGSNFAIYKRAREIVGHYAPMAIARILREQDDASVESPELTDDQLSRLQPARQRSRLIEADELVVTTRDVEFAIECQRACGDRRTVHFNGLDFRVSAVAQDGFDNRWVLTLLRCHRMSGGPYPDVREGKLTTEARIDYEGGAFIEFMLRHHERGTKGEVRVRLVERDGDPYHGLTADGFAFCQTLDEVFREGGSMTLELDGNTYTGVRIVALIKEA